MITRVCQHKESKSLHYSVKVKRQTKIMTIYFQAYANKKRTNYNTRLSSFMDEVSTAVSEEIDGKAILIGEELFQELEPVILTALEMYETNEYHVRDIADNVIKAIEKMRYFILL